MSLATPQPQVASSEGFNHCTGSTEPADSGNILLDSGLGDEAEEQADGKEKKGSELDLLGKKEQAVQAETEAETKAGTPLAERMQGDTNLEESNLEYVSDEEEQEDEPIDLTSESDSEQEVVVIDDTPNQSAEPNESSLEITQILEPLLERQIYVDLFSSQYRLFPARGDDSDECLFEDAEVCEASLKGLLEYIRHFLESNDFPFQKENALTVDFSKLGLSISEDDVYADDVSLYDIVSLFEGLRQKSTPEHQDVFLTLTIRSQERFITKYTNVSSLLSEGKGFEYVTSPLLERKRPLEGPEEGAEESE